MNSKATIREKYIAIRENLPKERRLEASLAATKQLLKVVSGFGCIISFASKKEEIDLWPLNKELARQERLILPRMVSGSEILPFQVKNLDQELVLHHKWKVLEPNPEVCKEISLDKIDFAIVPGVTIGKELPPKGRPQLIVKGFHLNKKKLAERETYLLEMQLIKRGYLK